MKRLFVLATLFGALSVSGCVSLAHNQVMTIPPSDHPVSVVTTARARCYDIFFIMWCRMGMKTASSDGQVIATEGWRD